MTLLLRCVCLILVASSLGHRDVVWAFSKMPTPNRSQEPNRQTTILRASPDLQINRLGFVRSLATMVVVTGALGVPVHQANAADVTFNSTSLIGSIQQTKKQLDATVSKEARKLDKAVTKEIKIVKTEAKQVKKEVKKEAKQVQKEVKKDIKKIAKETKKIEKKVGKEAEMALKRFNK